MCATCGSYAFETTVVVLPRLALCSILPTQPEHMDLKLIKAAMCKIDLTITWHRTASKQSDT